MKRSAQIERIRSLATAGLTPEAFIPALLETMHQVIPSDRNLFDWTDADGHLVRYFFEGPIDQAVAKHYFEEFHNRRESEVMEPFSKTMTGKVTLLGAQQLDRPEFYESALYNEIWRPQRLRSRIEAIVRTRDGRPLGSLVLYRGPGDRKFNPSEEELLERLAPYVAKGLTSNVSSTAEQRFAAAASHAYLCLGPDGEVAGLSEDAHRLLQLAHGEITPESASRSPTVGSFPALGTLWRQWIAQGSSHQRCSLEVRNAWGRFSFEGCAMKLAGPSNAPQLHVAISHSEFEGIAIRRAIRSFDLTPTQEQVCRHLHAGHTQSEIAEKLHIAPSTVIDHIRKIYTQLDVHSMVELLGLINGRVQASQSRDR